MRRIRRIFRALTTFLTQLGAALLKALVTSMVVAVFLVSVMHYMGVPVPNMVDLLKGVEKLAHVLS